MRKIKTFLIIFYFLAFLGLLVLQVLAKISRWNISFESLVYWWILLGVLVLVIKKEIKSSFLLYPAFFLFIFALPFSIFGIFRIGETLMRLSFIAWLVGITLALLEYKGNGKISSK